LKKKCFTHPKPKILGSRILLTFENQRPSASKSGGLM